MIKDPKIYLITSNAEAGTIETLPLTKNLEIIPSDHLEQRNLQFAAHQKVCITSETSIEIITNCIDIARANAIKALKDKFVFRTMLSKIYPNYQFVFVSAQGIQNLSIHKKSVIKPIKGCFGTGVRVIEPNTDFKQLSLDIAAELHKNGHIFSDSVLSKEDFILEQYIEGEEYAVDMFYNAKGEPCIVNIYYHPMPKNKAYLHMIYYSSKEVFDKIYEKAKAFFTELNKILGVTNFAMHSEFKLDNEDLMPIEINSMRFGGMGLGNLVFHALNVNPYAYFQQDMEPNWKKIWVENTDHIFTFFIAYNSANKSTTAYKPNREKLKSQFTQVLLEQIFDYQKQLAFAIYCLKETKENIEKLLKIEFDDYFE
jgi:ATP-grasp domain